MAFPRRIIEDSLLLKLALAKLNCSGGEDSPVYSYLKPKQVDCVLAAVSGDSTQDLLCVLPTGYGKSLIFQLIPFYVMVKHGHSAGSITIVLSPLNAIISQQLKVFGSLAMDFKSGQAPSVEDATSTSDSDSDDEPNTMKNSLDLKAGQYRFLIGHPEDFLAARTMKKLATHKWSKWVKHIVIDEAHCAVQWSTDFRPMYREIPQLRAAFPKANMVAVTATATIRMRQEIISILAMQKPAIISGDIDRPNIKYIVTRRPAQTGKQHQTESSYTAVFAPLVHELKSKGLHFPKTVVYSMLKWCGYGNELGVKILGNGEVKNVGVPEIAQFHAPLPKEMKDVITKEMLLPDSSIRLLLATEAYGMGVDTPDIRRVVHAGPPSSLETYSQETGRAGRDGQPANAILHFNSEDLGKKTTSQEMREYCLTKTCRREFLCKHFGMNHTTAVSSHDCCDNCHTKCECDDCIFYREYLPLLDDSHDTLADAKEEALQSVIHSALIQVFAVLNQREQEHTAIDAMLHTGLTPSLCRDISSNFLSLQSMDTLTVNYGYVRREFLLEIDSTIKQCMALF